MQAATLEKNLKGKVHCPICTHTVPAGVDLLGRRKRVTPGQRCPRCSATLDAAMVVYVGAAA